jgi:thioredoxin-dependent peroxiredoxin
MSKKSRKKTSRPGSGRPAGAQSAAASKSKAAKTGRIAPKKAAKKSPKKPVAAASHRAASKRLSATAKRPGAAAPATKSRTGKHVLAEGAQAPDFQLPRDGGSSVSLSDFAGQKLVLFFYPRADTPGCTREAIDFTRLHAQFVDCGTAVLGISADPQKAQESFRDKHKLGVPLVSDEKHEMLEAYGAWGEKSMYGKTFLGIIRTTVLVGEDGRIERIWSNVRVDGHAEDVLAAARGV